MSLSSSTSAGASGEMLVEPSPADAGFEPLLAAHGVGASSILLGVNETPGTGMPAGMLSGVGEPVVMFRQPTIEIVGMADVPLAGRLADEDVDDEHGRAPDGPHAPRTHQKLPD